MFGVTMARLRDPAAGNPVPVGASHRGASPCWEGETPSLSGG